MATSGDQYTYEVIFQPRGFEAAQRARGALLGFEDAMRDTADTADRYSSRMDAASGASQRFGRAAGGMTGANSRLAQGLMTTTYVIDDMQFGVRG